MDFTDKAFRCLKKVKEMMQKWSGKSWFHMLVHQGEFEADLEDCDNEILDCLITFMVSSFFVLNWTRS